MSDPEKNIYLGIDGRKEGPYSLKEIESLLKQARINPKDLCWKKGFPDWIPVGQLPGLEPEDLPPPLARKGGKSTPIVDLIDLLLNRIRGNDDKETTQKWMEKYIDVATLLGGYSVLIGGLIIFLRQLIVGIKNMTSDSLSEVIYGLAAFVITLVLHYLGLKFGRSNQTLVKTHRLNLPTLAVPKALALLFVVSACGCLVWGLILSVRQESLRFFLQGLFWMQAFLNLSLVFLRPEATMNVWPEDSEMRIGEYGLNLYSFFSRAIVQISPFVFGFGTFFAAIGLAVNGLTISSQKIEEVSGDYWLYSLALFSFGIMPLLIHLLYLVTMMSIDFIASVFQIERNTSQRPPQ